MAGENLFPSIPVIVYMPSSWEQYGYSVREMPTEYFSFWVSKVGSGDGLEDRLGIMWVPCLGNGIACRGENYLECRPYSWLASGG